METINQITAQYTARERKSVHTILYGGYNLLLNYGWEATMLARCSALVCVCEWDELPFIRLHYANHRVED